MSVVDFLSTNSYIYIPGFEHPSEIDSVRSVDVAHQESSGMRRGPLLVLQHAGVLPRVR